MEAEMEVEMEWTCDAIDSMKEIATIDTDYQQFVIENIQGKLFKSVKLAIFLHVWNKTGVKLN